MAGESITTATFDCYGTLIDWEGGLGSFLYEWARHHPELERPPARALRERWEAIQFELIQGPYRPYRDVIADSLGRLAEDLGLRPNELAGQELAHAMESWQPFPDTVPALRRAREAGLRLVIVSNTDRDIIRHTLRHLEVPFDEVVVAQDVRAYKPDRRPFDRALQATGESPGSILHVAFGFKYDIGPAQKLGMRTAWVNRKAEPRPGSEVPDYEWRDLWGFAAFAES